MPDAGRPRLAILSFSDVARDGRVLRHVRYAAGRYRVTVLAHSPWEPPAGVAYVELPRGGFSAPRWRLYNLLTSLGRRLPAAWDVADRLVPAHALACRELAAGTFDLIHAHDLDALPTALRAARAGGAKVVFDAHEYSPGQPRHLRGGAGSVRLARVEHVLRHHAPRADAAVTVGPAIADLYRRRFGLHTEVVRNVSEYHRVEGRAVAPQRVRLVHHGVALPPRDLESLIDGVAAAPERFELDLYLLAPDAAYLDTMRRRASDRAGGRIRFLDPVPPEEIVATLADYDVGVHFPPLEPLSYYLVLPNKLFEFIMAGLAVVVGPSPEMARVVREHGVGEVTAEHTPASLAATLAALTPEAIAAMKDRSLIAARQLNAAVELEQLERIYRRLLGTTGEGGRPRVGIVSLSDVATDGRVLRQIEVARRDLDVEVVGLGAWTPPPGVAFVPVSAPRPSGWQLLLWLPLLVAGRLLPPLWRLRRRLPAAERRLQRLLTERRYDLIHANELPSLPAAATAARRSGSRLLYDAHEYAPEQAKNLEGRGRHFLPAMAEHLLRHHLGTADVTTTVAPGIAGLYRRRFGVDPEVILNAPPLRPAPARGVDPDRVRLVHHGAAKPQRNLEALVDMMGHLDHRYHLTLMLVPGDGSYVESLRRRAAEVAAGRVEIRPPVAPDRIHDVLVEHDVGVYSLPPSNRNYEHALPNKLFDFLHAGLAVVIGPSPGMAELVRGEGCGVLAEGFSGRHLAAAVSSLDAARLEKLKQRSRDAARRFNAQVEGNKLQRIYRRLTSLDAVSERGTAA